jgi:Protein of unknown function (DUF1302)
MSASRFFSASSHIVPFPMRACAASILQSFALLSIAGAAASLFAVPAFAQGASASSASGCSPASGTPYQGILCGNGGGNGQNGQSPSPIAVSVTSPQTLAATPTWSAMQLETYGGAGGTGGTHGSDGGAGAAGSGITATVGSGVIASGANQGGIHRFARSPHLPPDMAVLTAELTWIYYPGLSSSGVMRTVDGTTITQLPAAGYYPWLNNNSGLGYPVMAAQGTASSVGATIDFNWTYDGSLIPGWQVTPGVALVQMTCLGQKFPIGMDTLSIEQDGILDSGRGGIFEPEHGEVELPLANAMHQFDA